MRVSEVLKDSSYLFEFLLELRRRANLDRPVDQTRDEIEFLLRRGERLPGSVVARKCSFPEHRRREPIPIAFDQDVEEGKQVVDFFLYCKALCRMHLRD